MSNSRTALLRMRDVCARTGLTRSTIHHYIREGVLPKPTKTGRNTALYDEDFVRRAQLVRALQEKTHMPLSAIRETLDAVPDAAVETIDLARFTGVTTQIADILRFSSETELSREDVLATTGLEGFELDGLAAVGLVDPLKRNGRQLYSPLDVRIARAIARIRRAGATAERGFVGSPQLIRAYRKQLTELARAEAKEMVRTVRSLAGVDLDEFVGSISEPLGDLVASIHRKALVQALTDLVGAAADEEARRGPGKD